MARLAGQSTISLSEMSQELDAKRYLGKDATPEQIRLFAELALDRIESRTLDGNTNSGTAKFTPYTEEYAAQKGVSRGDVDLFLNGDLLGSLSSDIDGTKVKLEIDDSLQTKIGFNHHTGDQKGTPRRPWFGITPQEARNIGDRIKQTTATQETQAIQESNSFTLADLLDAIQGLGVEFDGES